LDLGSHHIDLVRWLLDDEIQRAQATLKSDASEHDSAELHLTMAGGAEVQSTFSFRAALADYLEFIGDRGTLRLDRHRASLTRTEARVRGYGLRARVVAPTGSVARWWVRRAMHPGEDPSYERALRRFVNAIGGSPPRLATLGDGLRSLEVIAAAEASATACMAGSVTVS
jgi:predicted dehydrogenase